MQTPILELKNIDFLIGGFRLQRVNLSVYPGQVHVLMGENGSGKSLLMQIISGKLVPDSGEIYYEGVSYKLKTYAAQAGKNITHVQQDRTLLEHISIAENIYFRNMPYKNKLLRIIDYDRLNSQLRNLAEELQLPLAIDTNVAHLGLAQRQMLEFCKAYISTTKLVILDEPSDALTSSEKKVLYDIVRRIRDRGTGVLFITHRIEDVFEIGDKVSILRNGIVIDTKDVKECTSQDIIQVLSGSCYEEKYPKIYVPKGKTMLSVQHLSFGDILRDINFELREGEILGITGMAGSGRTLLAKCLFGMAAYQGQVRIKNRPLSITSPQVAIRNGIAFIPDNRFGDSIFQELRTDENVAFPSLRRFSKNKVINSSYLEQTVDYYTKKINFPLAKDQKISSYSGGSLQKVLFIKWLMSRANIFILDEPTHGVDLASKVDIYNFIADMVKKKASILFISSDVEEILGICDRVAVLSDQGFVCDVPVKSTSAEEIIQMATSGKK